MVKLAKIGVYGEKTRRLQERMAFERVTQTLKTANVYRYLGSRASEDPDIRDIHTTTFMEVPDRAYDQNTVEINIAFEPLPEMTMDYSQYGMIDPMGGQQVIRVHVDSYKDLGRPLINGDVLEIPFFEQDSHKAFWEIKDVDRAQEFEKFYAVITLNELTDDRTRREIPLDGSNDGILQDVDDQREAEAEGFVPHRGVDDTVVDNDEVNPDTDKEFDGRRKDQASFLDDFDGDLL